MHTLLGNQPCMQEKSRGTDPTLGQRGGRDDDEVKRYADPFHQTGVWSAMSLRDIPQIFATDSEDDLLHKVAQYFRELGFEADEMRFESQFTIRLGHRPLVVPRKKNASPPLARGRSDILLTRNGRNMAIVETKAPDHPLTSDDALQAISYARLLLQMAPFTIVTNGQETQVYDTYAGKLSVLENPEHSRWHKSGQNGPSISDDLRFEAARTLIGVNPQTLCRFCQRQVSQNLEDLKGTAHESKVYIPDTYQARDSLVHSFNDWLSSELPCFALVGESGFGKTNFMCAMAESLVEDRFVLFYLAERLYSGLLQAIANDFVWEFHRERGVPYIVERFDQIADRSSKDVLIFLDGIDEFQRPRYNLRNELLDLVPRLRGRKLRLCLSCKSFDWGDFVIDKGQTYNRLARAVYPARVSVHRPQEIALPDSKQIGIHVDRFSERELDSVFTKYKKVFSLSGELRGNTREECRTPLMLRLMADTYSNLGTQIPAEISSAEVYDLYWNRKMAQIGERIAAEQLVSGVADLCVESGERQIGLLALQKRVSWTGAMTRAYDDGLRLGLLKELPDEYGNRYIAFGFERTRSYIYTVRAQQWPSLPPQEVGRRICNSLSNRVGVEAVEFYLKTIDRGETDVLTELPLLDFGRFVETIEFLDLGSSITDQRKEERQKALLRRLEQYAKSYSELSRHYFPDLCERVEPYSDSSQEVGVWFWRSIYQFRTCTPAYPQSVVMLSDEAFNGLWNRTLPARTLSQLQPRGMMYMQMDDIATQLPHKLAWQRLRSQIASLITDRLLDESSSPLILQERVWDTLLHSPSTWFEGEQDPGRRYWRLLGFEKPKDVEEETIDVLMTRIVALLERYRAVAPDNVSLKSMKGYQTGAYNKTRELVRLYYWLGLLRPLCSNLDFARFQSKELFVYLEEKDPSLAVRTLKTILPHILESYRALVSKNFSQLSDRFALFRLSDRPVLAELIRGKRSDYLRVAYVLLPSASLPERFTVYLGDQQHSLFSMPLTRKTPRGTVTTTGGRSGRASISRQIGDLLVEEPGAFLYFTRYPSGQPILDQAYQLLGCDTEYLLGGGYSEWGSVDTGTTNTRQLDHWIARRFAGRRSDCSFY